MNGKLAILGIVVVVAGVLLYGSMFTVHQTAQALVLQFGNPVRTVPEPGLSFKIPFVQNVEYYDRRILDLDPAQTEIILADQKRVNVDAYLRYRIINPLEFRRKAQTIANFENFFGRRLNAVVRQEVGRVLLGDMLSARRVEVMNGITQQLKVAAPEFGVEVVDVRIGRTDLPADTAESVYSRMQSDRVAQAAKLRAEGEEQGQRIKAEADRQRVFILAEARKQSQILIGEGEGLKTRLLAEAYGKDAEFFDFYRSLEAYGEALPGSSFVLSPNSDFFRYFGDMTGRGGTSSLSPEAAAEASGR